MAIPSRTRSLRARRSRLALAGMLATACATAGPAPPPGPPDWHAVATERVAFVLPTDPDGSPRETRVVFVVREGTGIVRTGATRWFANLQRDPDIGLRIGESEYPVSAERIHDADEERAINAAFRAKYGLMLSLA